MDKLEKISWEIFECFKQQYQEKFESYNKLISGELFGEIPIKVNHNFLDAPMFLVYDDFMNDLDFLIKLIRKEFALPKQNEKGGKE